MMVFSSSFLPNMTQYDFWDTDKKAMDFFSIFLDAR